MRTTIAAASLVLLALAGCGADEEPAPEASPAAAPSATPAEAQPTEEPADDGVAVQVEVADGAVDPQGDRVEVKVGQEVTLTVTSDAVEEIHVHSDPERTLDVGPGETVEETFTIDTPGQVAVEAHELGVTIVQLVVRP